jgi:hypothetical protein
MLTAITSQRRRGREPTVLVWTLCALGPTLVGCGAAQAGPARASSATPASVPIAAPSRAAARPAAARVLLARRAASTRPSVDAAPRIAKMDETAFDVPRFANASSGEDADAELPHDVVRAALHSRARQLRGCYEQERAGNPDLAGKLVVAWTVDRRGVVRGPAVTTRTLESRSLEACVVRELERVSFPRRVGGPSRVEYPFVFRPN